MCVAALSGAAAVHGRDRSVHSCGPENPQTQHGEKGCVQEQHRASTSSDEDVCLVNLSC